VSTVECILSQNYQGGFKIQGDFPMGFFRLWALLLATCLSAWPASAKTHHPTFIAPGFQFSQIDAICAMPLIDNRQNQSPPLNLGGLRSVVLQELEALGYRANSDCAGSTQDDAHAATSRWLLTVRVDVLWAAGARLTGSLFDTQAGKEVWADSAVPGFGGRYKNALAAGLLNGDQLVSSSFPALFKTFQNRKKKG
jgi:hypothetical protein